MVFFIEFDSARWAQCSQVISLKEQEGIYEDPTILAIKQIEFVVCIGEEQMMLQGAQVKERENPYFLYQCSIHKINCVRNKEGEVIEGKPDEIKNVYVVIPNLDDTLVIICLLFIKNSMR